LVPALESEWFAGEWERSVPKILPQRSQAPLRSATPIRLARHAQQIALTFESSDFYSTRDPAWLQSRFIVVSTKGDIVSP
jgi:hypothetical protein